MNEWIRNREIRGRVTFSIDDVREAFPEISEATLATAIQRSIKSGRIQKFEMVFT